MHYFIDTNVALGYTIIHDKWHPQSDKFITETSEDIFWSNLVKEYSSKLNNIENSIDFFLQRTKLILKNNQKDFVNYYDFEKLILKETKICNLDKFKKQKILENFWNKYDFDEGISEIISTKFNDFTREFEKMYSKRDYKLNSTLKFHDCGIDNYLNYLDHAKKLYTWGVHKQDCKIIADAHDCGLTHNDLIFVSNDSKMLEKIIIHDTSFLNIIEFKSFT
ncbi:hypothetical protein [Methanobrevibacter sp. UBA212]|uniref:hypothetical protein n=1 Tax=Methanobrevibacter sp. UBA212 TaxID=1915476 RepID=UPI0025D86EAE|nr:hypothetical protein [Methanobrevibacter sp. UBA212]